VSDTRPPIGPLIAIVGPTGTGKTELAIEVASRIDGEIVGCDALQVYRGLDAATAKPTAEQRRRVQHHLIDFVDPARDFSMAEYARLSATAVREIASRNRVPIVVGGTGLYLRALLRGVVPAPPRDERLRSRLRRVAQRRGPHSLHRWLARRDPSSADRLAPGDTQRVVRALELALIGDRNWSERLNRSGTWKSGRERCRSLKVGLDMDRETLKARLAARVDRFFEAGLVDEVRRLLDDGVPASANSLKAIGYRQVVRAIECGEDPDGARESVVIHTRRYAKKQRTWFRAEPDVQWLDAGRAVEENARWIAERWVRDPALGAS
jgi:tRNA dimethylallyltransferase